MKWLRKMLGRDPGERERKAREIAVLRTKSDVTLERVDRALAERQRVIDATRGAVNAIQRSRRV